MVGLQSLAPGQAPMPGQGQMAGQPAMPGMLPKPQGVQQAPTRAGLAAFVPTLKNKSLEELIGLLNSPQKQYPADAIISAMAEQQKAMAADEANKRQLAMMQARQQPTGTVADQIKQGALHALMQKQGATQMAAHGGVMRGYAGGGAVAFQSGGLTLGFAPDYELARKYGINLSPYDSPEVRRQKIERARAMAGFEEQSKSFGEIPTEASVARDATLQQAYADPTRGRDVMRSGIAAAPAPSAPAPSAAPGGQRRQPVATPRSGLGALASPVEQTGTPAPDALSSIEAEAKAQSEGLQKLLAAQGQVDPRIIAARKEAAELAQRNIGEREKRAAGSLEAAGLPLSQNLFDNQEALFRMLGAMKGGKRLGDAFSSIGQEAGAIRGEQRKALETAQRENRLEQNALDRLREAQAELKLAQETNDVTGERNAALKVEEAKANLITTRLNIQKERAAEADRAEQREIQRRTAGAQEKTAEAAMIGAKARAEGAGSGAGGQRLALSQMKADPDYKRIQEELVAAGKLAASLPNNPKYKTRLENAQREYAALAKAYGVDLKAATPEAAAGAGAATNDPLGIRKP